MESAQLPIPVSKFLERISLQSSRYTLANKEAHRGADQAFTAPSGFWRECLVLLDMWIAAHGGVKDLFYKERQ